LIDAEQQHVDAARRAGGRKRTDALEAAQGVTAQAIGDETDHCTDERRLYTDVTDSGPTSSDEIRESVVWSIV
jgi:hypothetical protein